MLKRALLNRISVATILLLSLTLIAAAAQVVAPAPGKEGEGQKLSLNIYLDETGKTLITGYVQDISGLPFLSASAYRYENDTMQLYALTDALTYKDGDLWSLNLQSGGHYDNYHLTIYLPDNLGLKGINNTAGLQYLLSASNQSLVVDVQGYDIENPGVMIDYQQPLQDGRASNARFHPFALTLALLLSLGFAFYLLSKGRDGDLKSSLDLAQISKASGPEKEIDSEKIAKDDFELPSKGQTYSTGSAIGGTVPDRSDGITGGFSNSSKDPGTGSVNESDENKPLELAENEEGLIQSNDIKPFYLPSPYPEGSAEEASKKEIEVTSEMKAVMETLTPRERAILEALIKAGGRITQSDLRHETGTPRSSLSGILLSLERRKIIIKDKSGCTNVIELSDWFSSKKEPY